MNKNDLEFIFKQNGEKQFSRRNEVYVIKTKDNDFVLKRFKDKQSFETEVSNLMFLSLKNVKVPILYYQKSNAVILQYIEGRTYEQLLACADEKKLSLQTLSIAANELCLWLKKYYDATGNALRGDINLRNFIFTGEGDCAGVDFEEAIVKGRRELDIGRILAFTATYEPAFTEVKKAFCKEILNGFLSRGADLKKIKEAYDGEFKAMAVRRPDFGYESESEAFWESIVN